MPPPVPYVFNIPGQGPQSQTHGYKEPGEPLDIGADERRGARGQADMGQRALVPDEEAGIMGEKPESPNPSSSQVGGARTREEGNAARSASLSRALVAPACGQSLRTKVARAPARISPQPGQAQLRSFPG